MRIFCFSICMLFGLANFAWSQDAKGAKDPPKDPAKDPPKEPAKGPKDPPKDPAKDPPKEPANGPKEPEKKSLLQMRYGYESELRVYPQKEPKDTIESIIKAVIDQRIDYVLAHLADPGYVDAKVANYARAFSAGTPEGKELLAFRRFVKETTNLYLEDAERIQDLRLFAKSAEWKIDDDRAVGTLKQLGNRQVYLIRREDRWFLENRPTK